MLELVDWVQNKWKVHALNNECNMHKKKHLIKEPPPFQFHDVDVETMKQSKLKDCIVRNNALDSDEGTNAVGTAALNDTTSDHEEDEEDVELDDDEDPLDNDEWFE